MNATQNANVTAGAPAMITTCNHSFLLMSLLNLKGRGLFFLIFSYFFLFFSIFRFIPTIKIEYIFKIIIIMPGSY